MTLVENADGTVNYTPSDYTDISTYDDRNPTTISANSDPNAGLVTSYTNFNRSLGTGGPRGNGFLSTITIGDIKDLGQQNSVYKYAEAAKKLDDPNSTPKTLAQDGLRLSIEGSKVELLQSAVKSAVQNIQGRARAVAGQ